MSSLFLQLYSAIWLGLKRSFGLDCLSCDQTSQTCGTPDKGGLSNRKALSLSLLSYIQSARNCGSIWLGCALYLLYGSLPLGNGSFTDPMIRFCLLSDKQSKANPANSRFVTRTRGGIFALTFSFSAQSKNVKLFAMARSSSFNSLWNRAISMRKGGSCFANSLSSLTRSVSGNW